MALPTLNLDLTKYIINALKNVTYMKFGNNNHFYSKSRDSRLYVDQTGFSYQIKRNDVYHNVLEVYLYRYPQANSLITKHRWDLSFRDGKIVPKYRYANASGEHRNLNFPLSEEEHFQYSLLDDCPSWEDISDALGVMGDIYKLIVGSATNGIGKGDLMPTHTDYDIRIESPTRPNFVVSYEEIDEIISNIMEKIDASCNN